MRKETTQSVSSPPGRDGSCKCTRCRGTGKLTMRGGGNKQVDCVYCRGTGQATSKLVTK